jgi:hypothetical protein
MFNRAKFGYFGLSPLVAWNLAVRTTPFYDEIADPGLRAPLVAERNRRYAAGENVYHAVFEVDNDLLYRGGRPLVERSQSLRRMALTLIRRNKTQYLQEVARSLATFWFPKEYFEPGLDLPDLRRWDSQSLARARGRGGELYLPPAMIKLSKAVEGGMTLAFFGSLTIVIGILAIGLPISGSWAVAFFTCAAIVIGNAITACAVDMGLVRQRGSTDVLLLLGAFLGWLLLREARRRARGTIGA